MPSFAILQCGTAPAVLGEGSAVEHNGSTISIVRFIHLNWGAARPRDMAYLMGIDEAGYGPNLGPLVVAGSLWETNADLCGDDLFTALAPEVSSNPEQAGLVICDSKRLHQPQRGLARLEENVLAAWWCAATGLPGTHGMMPLDAACLAGNARSLDWGKLRRLSAQPSFDWSWDQSSAAVGGADRDEWYYDLPEQIELPLEAQPERIEAGRESLQRAMDRTGVRLMGLAFVEVSPRCFNRLLAHMNSKGALLTGISLLFIESLLQHCLTGPIQIVCDKHGGRDRYRSAIERLLGNEAVKVLGEAETSSRYCWVGRNGEAIELEFRARGEGCLPVALASMTAKYVREVRMEAWNRFWQLKIPTLAPTKGYPSDAKRFLEEIRPLLSSLRVSLDDVWRMK